ncbi:hypothetical protein F511_19793 [Dorcoceras hygrometricum]|uniref:Uncharacterized protein n=1 Tax=Dorcoceras hygrometricum TaxID=472368 RepID=A0A2Z7CK61_9LAMI|nr:hypothetical protein F511_19793 [Dorcoceras hygrometricum]
MAASLYINAMQVLDLIARDFVVGVEKPFVGVVSVTLCESWRQQRLRGFQQESAIGFRNGDVLESNG